MKTLQFSPIALVLVLAACGANDNPQASPQTVEQDGLGHRNPNIAQVLTQKNIVSDQAGVALMQDPNLVNSWGLAFNASGGPWIADNGTGLSTVYDNAGNLKLTVTISPPPEVCTTSGTSMQTTPTSTPTGLAFNADTSLFDGDVFVFVTEDGTIAGWQPADGTNAVLRVDNSTTGAVYKGVALASVAGTMRIYAANFNAGTIDAFDKSYAAIKAEGGFVDPNLPAGYAPFNVQQFPIGIVVTYAVQDAAKHDDVAGVGNGIVDLYDSRGAFQQRLISNGALNSPWGLVMAPSSFGQVGGQLLVGNFGDGMIHAYSVASCPGAFTVALTGTIGASASTPLVIPGLWALEFGPGLAGFDANTLYFTAGPDHEMHGLFGQLSSLD